MKKLLSYVLIMASLPIYAQDGTFDPSFGSFGQVIAVGEGGEPILPFGKMQNDNKIVYPFLMNDAGGNTLLCAIRFNPDGSRDTTFGVDGIARSSLLVEQTVNLVIQPDGKIIVEGLSSEDSQSIALIRFLPNGLLDPQFLNQIIPTPDVEVFYGLAIDKNQKIYVTGQDDEFIYLFRLNQSGHLDTSFNGTGFVTIPSPNDEDVFLTYCAIDNQNRIVISAFDGGGSFLTRVLENGTLDTSFNGTGYYIFPSDYRNISSPVIDRLGRILVELDNIDDNIYEVSRVLGNGSLDVSFGDAGFAALPTPDDIINNFGFIAINSNETILATSTNIPANSATITRLTSTGQIDESFGNNGSVSIVNPLGGDLFFPFPLIDSQNNIYIASLIDDTTIMVNKLVQPSIVSSKLSQALWLRYYNQL